VDVSTRGLSELGWSWGPLGDRKGNEREKKAAQGFRVFGTSNSRRMLSLIVAGMRRGEMEDEDKSDLVLGG